MALTEDSVIDKVEVLSSGVLQIRRADRVLKDGVVIATQYHRHTIAPGDDVSEEEALVQNVAGAVHTPKVISAWSAAHPAEDE